MKPVDVTEADIAFPARGVKLLPPMGKIPEKFKRWDATEWHRIADSWFSNGLPGNVAFYAKKGINAEKAVRHLKVILGSYAPKHEHKIWEAAYLMSLWFEKVENWETNSPTRK